MRRFRYFSFLLISLLALSADNPLERTIAALKKYVEELPQEKIYIQFDRPYYASGDHIWFKAYLVTGPHHGPSMLSQTIYVELLDPERNLIRQIRLFNQNGSVAGDFGIPEKLRSGNYIIRAYTQWMRNFSDDYFFYHQLTILNPEQPPQTTTAGNAIDVQFFPEGGEWISGFRSKLAFKATGADGLGKKIAGKIVDDAGNRVAHFESNFLGMGWCAFIPLKDKIYRALVDEPKLEVILPKVLESGITLAITHSPDQTDVVARIQASTPGTIYLIAQTRGLLCFASKIVLRNPISFVKIPVNNFPTGVAQLTVLDESSRPQAERLIFIDQNESLSIDIKANKKKYLPREKVMLSIEVKDEEGKPIASDLSLSACDAGQIPYDKNSDGIYSYLYLASELNGNIESPGYYFNPANLDRLEALDILLLTQGWRRFQYTSLLKEWPKPVYDFEQGLTLKGKLVDLNNGKPVAGGKVSFLSTYPSAIRFAHTNANGYFEIPQLFFSMRRTFSLRAKPGKVENR